MCQRTISTVRRVNLLNQAKKYTQEQGLANFSKFHGTIGDTFLDLSYFKDEFILEAQILMSRMHRLYQSPISLVKNEPSDKHLCENNNRNIY